MKKQVFYIHGGDSFSKQEDFLKSLTTMPVRNLPGKESSNFWTKTLAEELGEEYDVFKPSMPNSQNAHYEEWKIWFERHFEYLNHGLILVGWSLGGMFLAKYLSENTFPFEIKAIFLLAAPCGTYADEFGNDCGSFQFDTAILAKMAQYKDKIQLWHSKDDFVVPFQHVLEYKKYLPEAQLVTFEDKNHFLITEFTELLDKIRTL
jgi:predicted alpha/beta hydrolase family esterase